MYTPEQIFSLLTVFFHYIVWRIVVTTPRQVSHHRFTSKNFVRARFISKSPSRPTDRDFTEYTSAIARSNSIILFTPFSCTCAHPFAMAWRYINDIQRNPSQGIGRDERHVENKLDEMWCIPFPTPLLKWQVARIMVLRRYERSMITKVLAVNQKHKRTEVGTPKRFFFFFNTHQ